MQTFSAPTAVRSASGAQTDRVCSRKTQLAVLLALDAFVVVGMIFATMVQFVKTGSTDVTLSSSSVSAKPFKAQTSVREHVAPYASPSSSLDDRV